MKPFNHAYKKIILAMVMACLFLPSCGKDKEDESRKQEQQEQQKAIKALEKIEAMNETIIQLLSGPVSPGKTEGQKQQGGQEQQGQDQGQGKDQQQGQQQQGQQQQGQQQGQQQQQSQQQQGKGDQEQKPQDKIWEDVNKNIIELHSLFNEYIPEAAKLGASTDLSSNANNALNELTKKAEDRNHNEALTEANNLYKAICDYFVLHQDKRAPAKLLLFHARRVMLAAKTGDWQTAEAAMNELEGMWNTQKTTYTEKQKDAVAVLDLSVSNLSGVVTEKDQNLTAIKGLVVLQNISELEKNLEE